MPTVPDPAVGTGSFPQSDVEPYYADEFVRLYHGDFRDVLPRLRLVPDLVVTDPPYGETALSWDTWPEGWPDQIPGNSMWCFGSMRMFLVRSYEFAHWKFSQDVIWEKHNGSNFADDRLKRVHEHALHWYRGDWASVYHRCPMVAIGEETKNTVLMRTRNRTPQTGDIGASAYIYDGRRLRRSVIYCPSMHGSAINEAEKPRGILEPLVEYGCPPRGLVLDPFAGSCSTLVAARALGRRAVGIEKREEQCEKAVQYRLSQGVLSFDDIAG